jgi:hypothetical protein
VGGEGHLARNTVAGALLGLAVACGGDAGKKEDTPQALYGSPPTPTAPALPETPGGEAPKPAPSEN